MTPKPLPSNVRACTSTAKLLWVYLRGRNHRAYPLRNIADALGISLEACRKGLDELESHGAISRERRGSHPSVIHVNLEEETP